MNNQHLHTAFESPVHREALEGRVALAFTARLQRGADDLPHDVTERLRFARQQALSAAAQRQRRLNTVTGPTLLGRGPSAILAGGPAPFWLRLASVMPLALLVVGMVMIQHHHDTEQIQATAELDSALLADELPPDAYRDPGFGEFLRSGSEL